MSTLYFGLRITPDELANELGCVYKNPILQEKIPGLTNTERYAGKLWEYLTVKILIITDDKANHLLINKLQQLSTLHKVEKLGGPLDEVEKNLYRHFFNK